MFPLICARINRWANNRHAGDLRRHRGHYGVTVIRQLIIWHIIWIYQIKTLNMLNCLKDYKRYFHILNTTPIPPPPPTPKPPHHHLPPPNLHTLQHPPHVVWFIWCSYSISSGIVPEMTFQFQWTEYNATQKVCTSVFGKFCNFCVSSSFGIFYSAMLIQHHCHQYPCGNHYRDVIMSVMAFQITGVPIACSTSQRPNNAENVSIWWRHHVMIILNKWKWHSNVYKPLMYAS